MAAMAAAVRSSPTFCLLSGFVGTSVDAGFCCGAGVDCGTGAACLTAGVTSAATGWAVVEGAIAAVVAGEWFAGAS
jgi:hypothetical protein